MIKFRKNCPVCTAIKGNAVLTNRIYNSAFFMKGKGESLLQIAEDNKGSFSYHSLKNHVKKHQFLSEEDFTKRHLNHIAQTAEKTMLKRAIESKQVWDEVISVGMQRLQEGELKFTAGHLLKAAKDKSDFEFKQKDQQLVLMEMVAHFASGEYNREDSRPYDRRIVEGEAVTDFDPAARITDDSERRENESRSFYQSLAGDAATPRAD